MRFLHGKHQYLAQFKKCIFISLLTFFGCTSQEPTDERLFLENVMIREGGLYVLMGSKPMITFPIDSGYPQTEEECLRSYQQLTADPSIRFTEPYVEYKNTCLASKHLHHKTLWAKWKEMRSDSTSSRYRIVSRKSPFGEKRECGVFINLPNTLFILKENYQDFVEVYGAPFDPAEVLKEIANEESLFWKRIFSNHYTQGLLYGYGKRNAFAFAWRMQNDLSFPRITVENQEIDAAVKNTVTVNDLGLPTIALYSFGDETLQNYRRERKEILKQFKRKDFELIVKRWLYTDYSNIHVE